MIGDFGESWVHVRGSVVKNITAPYALLLKYVDPGVLPLSPGYPGLHRFHGVTGSIASLGL